MNKSKFRYMVKAKKFEKGYVSKSNAAITSKVITHPIFQNADHIFCYVSVDKEVDTRSIIKYALRQGKTVSVPLCQEEGKMIPKVIYSLSELCEGAYGIPEPPDAAPNGTDMDLCIVPCMCADKERYRLGHGGGYYDRFMAEYPGVKMLLCREELIYDPSIEKLTSGWRGSRAEVSFAKSNPEVTFTNIFTAIDLSPPVTYNINALLMRRIGQR